MMLCSDVSLLVNGQTRETEAIKLISVRAGLLDMSQAWESLGRRCTLLSESQRVCSVIQ